MQEAITSLGENIFDNIRCSQFVALMCDETKDITVKKELTIYARYIEKCACLLLMVK